MTLDINLPDIDGWRVLDRIKGDLQTRHIPVCVISTDDSRERAMQSGAISVVGKPIASKDLLDAAIDRLWSYAMRSDAHVLVIEPKGARIEHLLGELELKELDITVASNFNAALDSLNGQQFDCLIADATTPDLDPASIARWSSSGERPHTVPVIVFGEGSSDPCWNPIESATTLRRIRSTDRLLDEMAFVLHRPVPHLGESLRKVIEGLHRTDRVLAGKVVLIVDDDIRNIFALTTVLEEHDMIIESADTGRAAIDILQRMPNIDIVLMDIMMPEMDGIDTMRELRRLPALKDLPIVAVTAKAMKGDREKCIEAGAWDYLAKPVDPEQLLSVLRAWLHR
jgi:CheY-like chemotaxis protein